MTPHVVVVLQMDLGYIGCASDVLTRADLQCSGRRKCDITIPDTTFEATEPCYEVQSYLEATYSCVTGEGMWWGSAHLVHSKNTEK